MPCAKCSLRFMKETYYWDVWTCIMLNIAKGIDKKKFLHKLEIQFFVTKHFCMKEEKKTDFFQIRYAISPYSYLLGIRCEIWSYFIYGSDIRPSNNMSVNEIIWNFNAFTPVPFGKLSHNFFQIWYTPGISHDQKMQIFSLGMFQNASICGDKLIF